MKEDVSIIYTNDNVEHVLDTVTTFGSNDVSVICNDTKTTYICDYKCNETYCYKFIVEIKLWKSFRMIGGILKHGTSSRSLSSLLYNFIEIDDGYVLLRDICLIYISDVNNVIYVRGGSVCMEYMKINKEEWMRPIFEVYGKTSWVSIEMKEVNIRDCNYSYGNNDEAKTSIYKSGVGYIYNMNNAEKLIFNISNCLFEKNDMNLFYSNNGYGYLFKFSFLCDNSSMLY
jgi:hypothetical protein